ncbi:MAG TPA: methylmalonyl Co-A mutase-associated GTPase MeaB [Anaerolineales bacterium]|nr:methylmalonyl Co-A mutase-associated GTPase MeaB [Anaerolineales bacterium]
MISLAETVLRGDRLALGRVLTLVENDTADGRAALEVLFPHTGQAHLVGVTGAPGTGKSSLVNRLALQFRTQNKRVAVVAVDPSSPFTGGALLGDRVRMKDLSGDTGVFIRSMASRGSIGGLAQATASMVQIFDAAGYEIIMIETVGAGQSEVDIARLAHTTLVVEAPGLGDDIQAIKAGILEIADIIVVNKADRPGVENTEKALKSMLELAHPAPRVFSHHGGTIPPTARGGSASPGEGQGAGKTDTNIWIPPVQRTIATDGTGIAELAQQIVKHGEYLRLSGDWTVRERARLESELEAALRSALMNQFHARVPEEQFGRVVDQVLERSMSPSEAVRALLNGRPK